MEKIVSTVIENPSDFKIIYQLIFDTDNKVAWRAAWACIKISDHYPDWFSETQSIEIISHTLATSHYGLLRSCLSILLNLTVPGPIPVEFINACFEWMVSPKTPVAVQSLSMKMLLRICDIEPYFKPELIAYLENPGSSDYSPGFNSTRKNVLKALTNK